MLTKTIKSYTLMAICLSTAVIAHEQHKQKGEAAGTGVAISEIREYRKMFRVNHEPVDMVESTKYMCAPPRMIYGPHYDPGVVYYINDIARQGVKAFKTAKRFPVGSIVVKEKQERRTEDSVHIITVMRKVRPGRGEDSWEYKMYDTTKWSEIDASKSGAHSTSPSCIDCHRRYESNDYVSDKGMELLLRK